MRVAGFDIPKNTKCPVCYDKRAKLDPLIGVLPCNSCTEKRRKDLFKAQGSRPMTEWERLKLSWYRNEKKWQENIQSRKIVFHKGEKKIVTTDNRGNITGELPKAS